MCCRWFLGQGMRLGGWILRGGGGGRIGVVGLWPGVGVVLGMEVMVGWGGLAALLGAL